MISRPLVRVNGATKQAVSPSGTHFLAGFNALLHGKEFSTPIASSLQISMQKNNAFAEKKQKVPRSFIGKEMASREMLTVLRDVLAKFEFSLADETVADLVTEKKLEEVRNLLRSSDLTMRPTRQLRM